MATQTQPRLKILHFRREVATHGGPESLIIDISRYINRERFDLHVALLSPLPEGQRSEFHEELLANDTPVTVLPAKHKFDRTPIRVLGELLDRNHIDILHAHDHRSNLIAHFAARNRRTRRVATLHQPLRRYWWLWHWEWLDEQIVCRADLVLPVADAIGLELVNKHPKMRERTKPILNGVDLEHFRPVDQRATIRAEWGIPADAPLFAAIARFMPDKNLPALLNAARKIVDHRQDLRWVIVGRGPLEAKLRTLCTSLKLDDYVHFAGFRSDIPEVLSAIDTLVVPSTSEGCCVAILEAMACGKPVIATDVGGTKEVVIDGQTGFVIQPNDIPTLAQRMEQMADDPALYQRLADASHTKAQADFSVIQMVRNIEAAYEELMQS